MKTKKKGFSLVELICTITIAAIIAAAAAPNVSAYIQNSKLQNYSTALNNLVGELQMQLPQKRYWNWQEVSETAEAILRNEVSRDITSSESGDTTTYSLTNVSTDEDVEFKLEVTYGVPSGIQQEITIDGFCTDYPSVKTEDNKCTVTLKNNYVDKGNYPTITIPGTEGRRDGWFNLLDDRVKDWSDSDSDPTNDWKSIYDNTGTRNSENGVITYSNPDNQFLKENPNVDFVNQYYGTHNLPQNKGAVLNICDYPMNSVTEVQFKMDRYYIENISDHYEYNPVAPVVWTNTGDGRGHVYQACGLNASSFEKLYENVMILVGDNEDLEENWVKYTDVFDSNYFPRASNGSNDAVKKYMDFYNDRGYRSIENGVGKGNVNKQITLTYRVKLKNPDPSFPYDASAKGWIEIWGKVLTKNDPCIVKPAKKDGIYDGIRINVNIPEYNSDKTSLCTNLNAISTGEYYFVNSGLTTVEKNTSYSVYLDAQNNIQFKVNGTDGNTSGFTISDYKLVNGDKTYTLNNDGNGRYYYTEDVTQYVDPWCIVDNNWYYQVLYDNQNKPYIKVDFEVKENIELKINVYDYDLSDVPSYAIFGNRQLKYDHHNNTFFFDNIYSFWNGYKMQNVYLRSDIPSDKLPCNAGENFNVCYDSNSRIYWYEYKYTRTYIAYIDPDAIDNNQIHMLYDYNSGRYYYQFNKKYYLTDEQNSAIAAYSDRIKNFKQGTLELNLDKTGYSVGDVLKITVRNVNADILKQKVSTSPEMFLFMKRSNESGGYIEDGTGVTRKGYFFETADCREEDRGIVHRVNDNTVEFFIRFDWSMWPYFEIKKEQFGGLFDDFSIDDIELDWAKKTPPAVADPITVTRPMATINGNDDYAVLTFDWSHCSDETAADIGKYIIKFSKPLNYEIYDMSFNRICEVSGTDSFDTGNNLPFAPVNYEEIIKNQKVVNLYFKGISANDIQYTIQESSTT